MIELSQFLPYFSSISPSSIAIALTPAVLDAVSAFDHKSSLEALHISATLAIWHVGLIAAIASKP
jgi:hypothetical protein